MSFWPRADNDRLWLNITKMVAVTSGTALFVVVEYYISRALMYSFSNGGEEGNDEILSFSFCENGTLGNIY